MKGINLIAYGYSEENLELAKNSLAMKLINCAEVSQTLNEVNMNFNGTKLELVESLINSITAESSQILPPGIYYNPSIGKHETVDSYNCKIYETREDIAENFCHPVDRYWVKGWQGYNAEKKRCLKGIQIIDIATKKVYWIRKQSKTVIAIEKFLVNRAF